MILSPSPAISRPKPFGQGMKTVGAASAVLLTWLCAGNLAGQSPYDSTADFEQYARKMQENAIQKKEPQVFVPTTAAPTTTYQSRGIFSSRYPWKENIVTTVFNIGELPTPRNPTPNHSSSWDPNWEANYGGFDDPEPSHRRGFLPPGFIPRQNPFYCALPYNDVTRGHTKPEAKLIIPWFNQAFEQEGHTVCKGRWIAIRHGNRVAYAQWEDCGPFSTESYQYVFGKDLPRPNLNGGAGVGCLPRCAGRLGDEQHPRRLLLEIRRHQRGAGRTVETLRRQQCFRQPRAGGHRERQGSRAVRR